MAKYILAFIIALIILISSVPIFADESGMVESCTISVDCETGDFGISSEEIAKHPRPDVEQVYADQSVVFDRRYRRISEAIDIFDTPGGNVVDRLDAGFNFVTLMNEQDGWAQIATDRWVQADKLTTNVQTSTFSGLYLPEESLPYTVAWILVNVYPSMYPGGDPSESNELLMRYTTVYIYDAIMVDDWRWYQVGEDAWVKQTQVAKILPVERFDEIDTERWFSIDLYEQVMIAYEGDRPVFASLVSSGMSEWATNEGLFHVYIRFPRTPMSGAYGQPDFYYLQEVPWTMYFDNDIALHGAYWHDGFGYRRSHGCVNLSVYDAYLMYQWSTPEFDFSVPDDTGPAVYVYSSGKYD